MLGPSAASIFHPNTWGGHPTNAPGTEITREITLEVMRVCISLSVFSVGVEVCRLCLTFLATEKICLAALALYLDVVGPRYAMGMARHWSSGLGLHSRY